MEFENIENFNPRSCINGKVMRLGRMIDGIFRKHLSPFELTSSQTSLMFVLSKKGKSTQKELSELQKLEKSSLNRNIQRLIQRKLLSKSEFPLLQLTHEGKVLVNAIIPEWQKAMQEVRDIIDADGEAALDVVLKKFYTKS